MTRQTFELTTVHYISITLDELIKLNMVIRIMMVTVIIKIVWAASEPPFTLQISNSRLIAI